MMLGPANCCEKTEEMPGCPPNIPLERRAGETRANRETSFHTETTLLSRAFGSPRAGWQHPVSQGEREVALPPQCVRVGLRLTSLGWAVLSTLYMGVITALPTSQACWKSNEALCKRRLCDAVLENIREVDTHHCPRDEGGLSSPTLKWTF